MTKRIVVTVATATMLLITGAVAQNQTARKVTGVVVHTPSGLATTGRPIANARVEYLDDSAFEGAEMLESFVGGYLITDDDGRFRVDGIVPDETFGLYAETKDGRRSPAVTLRATPGIPIENIVLRVSR